MSLYDFKAWLRTQPSDKAYDWKNPCICLMAQYQKATTGVDRMTGEPPDWYRPVTRPEPWTAGAALKRAEELV